MSPCCDHGVAIVVQMCDKYRHRGSEGAGGLDAAQRPRALVAPACASLLNPLVHLRSLRRVQGLHPGVAGPFGGSKRRRIEFRAAEEDDIHRDVVGDHLDDPLELWHSVARLLPLHGALKPGDRLADQFVQSLGDGMRSGITRRISSSMSAWLSNGTGGFRAVVSLRGFAFAASNDFQPEHITLIGVLKHVLLELAAWCQAEGGWALEVVERTPGTRGFSILPRRCVVERTLSWISRTRRMRKDYERNVQTSETLIQVAMIRLLLARLARKNDQFPHLH